MCSPAALLTAPPKASSSAHALNGSLVRASPPQAEPQRLRALHLCTGLRTTRPPPRALHRDCTPASAPALAPRPSHSSVGTNLPMAPLGPTCVRRSRCKLQFSASSLSPLFSQRQKWSFMGQADDHRLIWLVKLFFSFVERFISATKRALNLITNSNLCEN